MIRQPEQVTADLAAEQLTQIMKKKENRFLERIRFEEYQEGWSVQACHIGPFDTETENVCENARLLRSPRSINCSHDGQLSASGDLSVRSAKRQHQKKQKQSYAGG